MVAGLGALSIHTGNVMGTFRYQSGPACYGCLCMKESCVGTESKSRIMFLSTMLGLATASAVACCYACNTNTKLR
jgi:hypothetical protein